MNSSADSLTKTKRKDMKADTMDKADIRFQPRNMPDSFAPTFTDKDIEVVETIINWLNNQRKSVGFLASASGCNRGMVNDLVNGKYMGRVAPNLKKLTQTIDNIQTRNSESDYTPFVETSVWRMCDAAQKQARLTCMFAVIAMNVGLGKTRSFRQVTQDNSNTWMVECYHSMSPGIFLDKLIRSMSIPLRTFANIQLKFEYVLEYVSKIENGLLIVDEAETVQAGTLECIRRLSDLGRIGVVLSGTPKLYQIIARDGGNFDQVRSRAIFFPDPLYQITKDDARAIVSTSFDDRKEVFDEEGDLDGEIFEAFWALSGEGSMRQLVDGLIPAVHRYGIKQHGNVTAELVYSVAKKVLNLTPRKK